MIEVCETKTEELNEHFKSKGKIRHLVATDVTQMLEIDQICFCPHLTELDLSSHLKQKHICKIIELNDQIVGFSLYAIQPKKIEVFRIGIHPNFRRLAYGSRLVKEIYRKLTNKRSMMICMVSEYSDDTINFLKTNGFIATAVKRKACVDESDGYCFRLILQEALKVG